MSQGPALSFLLTLSTLETGISGLSVESFCENPLKSCFLCDSFASLRIPLVAHTYCLCNLCHFAVFQLLFNDNDDVVAAAFTTAVTPFRSLAKLPLVLPSSSPVWILDPSSGTQKSFRSFEICDLFTLYFGVLFAKMSLELSPSSTTAGAGYLGREH